MNCVSRSRPCSPCWTQPKARDHQRLTAVYGYTYNRAIEPTLKERNMSTSNPEHPKAESTEVDLMEVLAARVRAGAPIHINGPLDGPVATAHLSMVSRLRSEIGMPVHVIYG